MSDELIPGQWAFDGEHYGRARACALDECGRVFIPARSDAAYCSPACRQRAYRQRQGAPSGSGRHRHPRRRRTTS